MAARSSTKSIRNSKFTLRHSGRTTNNDTSKSHYHTVKQRRPWSPGLRRSPSMALGALVLTIAAIATCIGILVGSDGKPISSWTFQPTVYLAIATTIANICLHFAFAEGVTIAWWTKALRGTTVGELHRIHAFGNDFWAALLAFRYVNFLALACLIVTISPINGPLMQRASQVSATGTSSAIRSMNLPIAKGIPEGFTAYTSTRLENVVLLQRDFVSVVSEWNDQSPVHMKNDCHGTCEGNLRGAGFALNCTRSTLSFSLVPVDSRPENLRPGSQYFGIGVNSSSYGFPYNSGTISVVFKNTTSCKGELQIQNCTLQPATVIYPVTIDGRQQSISLQQDTAIFDDQVVSVFPEFDVVDGRTRFGGIYKALQDRYTTWAFMSNEPARGAFYSSSGFYSNAYAVIPAGSTNPATDCALSYANPLPDLLESARDLMFRAAVSAAAYSVHVNRTTGDTLVGPNDENLKAAMQTITVTESTSEPRYRSEYAWLAGALIVTLLPTLCVTGMFWGFWTLGRRVSMDPIETGKALGSPLLVSYDGNATGREVAMELNSKPVKYGGVARDEFRETATIEEGAGDVHAEGDHQALPRDEEKEEDNPRLRLLVKSPEMVLAPSKGWVFAG